MHQNPGKHSVFIAKYNYNFEVLWLKKCPIPGDKYVLPHYIVRDPDALKFVAANRLEKFAVAFGSPILPTARSLFKDYYEPPYDSTFGFLFFSSYFLISLNNKSNKNNSQGMKLPKICLLLQKLLLAPTQMFN